MGSLPWIISTTSGLIGLGVVLYIVYTMKGLSKDRVSAVERASRLTVENQQIIKDNEDLTQVNIKLGDQVVQLENAVERQRVRYETLVKDTISYLSDDAIRDAINERLRGLREMSKEDDH